MHSEAGLGRSLPRKPKRNVLSLETLERRNLLSGDPSLFALTQALNGASSGDADGSVLTAQALSATSMVVRTRDSYLPGVALLVQIELLGANGKPLRELWDANVTIGSTTPGVSFTRAGFANAGQPVTQVLVQNGVGSALVNVNGTTDSFTLTASYGTFNFSRTITSLVGAPQTVVTGTLPGAATTWSGVVHVTGDVTVPVNHTLTVQPGTLVVIDGTPPLPPGTLLTAEDGKDIIVRGTLNSLGTDLQPVTFTATNPTRPWGEINHDGRPATYQYTEITRGGHSPQDNQHTDTGPIMRLDNTTLNFDHVSITDAAGKIMTVDDSQLNWQNVHFARSVMGPEIRDSGLNWTDSHVQDMLGIYQEKGGEPDDNDGIYIHTQSAGQTVRIAGVTFVEGDDDGIDTLGPTATFEDLIIRGFDNPLDDSKGISITDGGVTIRRVLIVDTAVGIASKAFDPITVTTNIDHATVIATRVGILAERAGGGDAGAILRFNVNNSIVRAPNAVHHEYTNPNQDPNIVVTYSDLSETRTGAGNITADPQFVNPAAYDYHLQFGSPAIDTGDPASPLDPDGTRTDMGYAPYQHSRVAGRHIFYNESTFDDRNIAANANDDGAIATDKSPLLPGGTATFANYTSYFKGINGIMIDVGRLAGTPTAGDFIFRIGNDNAPGNWPLLSTAPAVSVRSGAGVDGSDRVTLIWPNFSVMKQWLQVTLKDTAQTGLASPDVFYFGNAVGEAGNSAIDARVTSTDEIYARNTPRSIDNPVGVTFPYDFNRDTFVSANDQIIARNSRTTFLNTLNLIQVPAALQAGRLLENAGRNAFSAVLTPQPLVGATGLDERRPIESAFGPLLSAQRLGAVKQVFAQLGDVDERLPRRKTSTAESSGDVVQSSIASSRS
jgi:hypothetical protein